MDQPKVVINNIYIRPSIFTLSFRIITIQLIFLGIYIFSAVLAYILQINITITTTIFIIYLLLVCGLVFVQIFLTLTSSLRWLDNYYIVNPNSITSSIRNGLSHEEKMIQLDKLANINLVQGFVGRIANYGTIILLDEQKRIIMKIISCHDPKRYINIFKKMVNTNPGVILTNNTLGEV